MNRQNILLVVSASIATALAMMTVPAVGQLVQGGSAPVPAAGPAPAQPDPAPQVERAVPASQAGMQQSFAPIVQRTAPAVVNVFSSVHIQRSNCPYAGTPWELIYCRNAQTRDEKVDNSLGSGVIVGSDGVIVTNNHVVERPQGLAPGQAQDPTSTASLLKTEFRWIHTLGGLYALSYHSQLMSRPEHLPALASLARFIASDTTVWVTTADAIAKWWRARSEVQSTVRMVGANRVVVTVRNRGTDLVHQPVVRVNLPTSLTASSASTGKLLPSDAGMARVLLPLLPPGSATVVSISLGSAA